ncbi:MAG: methyltransferase domain-containing protein [Isosphaeraceae bacterium]|nr:methyltransferase domain-containing protein [Isosphaeraceae bacterium]
MVGSEHDEALADAFDGQAAQFERAPVQSDPAALERLVRAAGLSADSLVLDAGCGPGLVSEALLRGGCRVFGVDLSAEMVGRARRRCAAFGDRARFEQGSLFDDLPAGPFDAGISRYVLHHVADPDAFVRRQVELLRSGGVLVLCDSTGDPDSERARALDDVERARDKTHTHNLAGGQIVDLFARAGLTDLRLSEEAYSLDFDEWFDRGTPVDTKENVRARFLAGPHARGFWAEALPGGSVRINAIRAIVRGVKP